MSLALSQGGLSDWWPKLSTDPQFIVKVVDVVGLYHHPPRKAVVLCVDEKSQIQTLDRSQPVKALENGIRDWIDTWNNNPRPFTRTKTADKSSNPSPATSPKSTHRPLKPETHSVSSFLAHHTRWARSMATNGGGPGPAGPPWPLSTSGRVCRGALRCLSMLARHGVPVRTLSPAANGGDQSSDLAGWGSSGVFVASASARRPPLGSGT